MGVGLACRGIHESEVVSVSQIIARSVRVDARGGFNRYVTALFYLALGALFIGYELFFSARQPGLGAVLGGLFLAYGIYIGLAVRRAYQSPAKA
ncbi:hypothetical protein GCM10027188_29220 [Lysobacter humi (ex Lee et al. 2017)]